MNPLPLSATLRLQFHRGFTLDQAIPYIPHLRKLGISHVIASSLLPSASDSHKSRGIVDFTHIDPDLGGLDGLRRFVHALRQERMGLILTVAPDAMNISPGNGWWRNVLRQGKRSAYAQYFDIVWSAATPGQSEKVLLPVLTSPLDAAIRCGALKLGLDETGHVEIRYGDQRYPVSSESEEALWGELNCPSPPQTDSNCESSATDRASIAPDVTLLDPGTTEGRSRLETFLAAQHYQLIEGDWTHSGASALVTLKMDRRPVFDDVHGFIFELYREGLIDGTQVDRIDRLTRPAEYCTRMRAKLDSLRRERPSHLQSQAPLFIEKSLAQDEILPLEWPVTGTTGHDFLEQVSLVLHHPDGEAPVSALWSSLGQATFGEIERATRLEALDTRFAKEFETLRTLLASDFKSNGRAADRDLDPALRAILAVFPVTRSYFADGGDSGADFRAIDRAHLAAQPLLRGDQLAAMGRICQYLADARIDTPERQNILERFESLTTQLAEEAETALARYSRLLSHNGTGGHPGRFSAGIADFHKSNEARQATHPQALLRIATPDTEWGETERGRLMVLSEPEAEWPLKAQQWLEQTRTFLTITSHGPSPVSADAYRIFQSLIASWSLEESGRTGYAERFNRSLLSALRDADQHTNWASPDESYEAACLGFAGKFITGPLQSDLSAYVTRLDNAAALNSLAQALLWMTSPGVPDLSQQDARRIFDPAAQHSTKGEHSEARQSILESIGDWKSGRGRQALIERVLTFRLSNPELFDAGRYVPCKTQGPLAEHVVAFERRSLNGSCLIVAPRLTLSLAPDDALITTHLGWTETTLSAFGSWKSLVHKNISVEGSPFSLAHLNGTIPFDILIRTG